MIQKVSESVYQITEEDNDLDLFESKYEIPDGVTYNSYVIIDEKVTVLDTMDARRTDAWLNDLKEVLGGRDIDYLIVHHMEPDHGANVGNLASLYPNMTIVSSNQAFKMIAQFFGNGYEDRRMVIKEGDMLSLGKHMLSFVAAPNVHWPEVMMSYETSEGLLFSADAFGRFGPADRTYDWIKGARRYYYNIVGKFGPQANSVIAKAAGLDIKKICPLHGPVLDEDLGRYIECYSKWTTYVPDEEGVFIAYASVYGNTEKAAFLMKEELEKKGVKVKITDLSRTEVSYAIEDAFTHGRMVLASITYEGGIFPSMRDFLTELISKKYCNRKIAIIDNGSWGPVAGKKMAEMFAGQEGIEVVEPKVSIRSSMNDKDRESIAELALKMSN